MLFHSVITSNKFVDRYHFLTRVAGKVYRGRVDEVCESRDGPRMRTTSSKAKNEKLLLWFRVEEGFKTSEFVSRRRW